FMNEHGQQLHRLTILSKALAACLSINRCCQRFIKHPGLDPSQKSRGKLAEFAAGDRSTDGCRMRWLLAIKAQRLLKLVPMSLSPPLEHRHLADPREQAEKY